MFSLPNRKKYFEQPIQVTTLRSNTSFSTSIYNLTTGGMQIPFATGTSQTLTTNSTGASNQIITSGLGASSGSSPPIILTDSQPYQADGSGLGGTFIPTYNNCCYFCMPCDAVAKGIKFDTTLISTLTANGTFYVYVALATALAVTDGAIPTFQIITETQTIAKRPFIYNAQAPASTSYSGEQAGFSVPLAAGTLVAIVCGIFQTDRIGTPLSITAVTHSGVVFLT